MPDAHKNFARSTVATAPSPATTGTSLVVAAGEGALFPTPPFNATVWPASGEPTDSTAEIVRVTAIATDTLTITREQEDSTARTIVVGDRIAATITKKTLTDVEIVYNVKAYGATGDGTTDDRNSIQAAIDAANTAGGGIVFFPGGTYRVESTLTLYSNITLRGVRGKSVLDYSQRVAYSTFADPFIEAIGTVASDINLTSNATEGSAALAMGDTSSLAVGDLLLIYSNETWQEYHDDSNEHGEFGVVLSVDSSTAVTLSNSLNDTYTTANTARIAKVTPVRGITIEGLKFKGRGEAADGNGDNGLVFIYGRDITIRDCDFERVDKFCICLMSLYGAVVENNSFYHGKTPASVPIQYGVLIANASTFISVRGNTHTNSRHAVVTGHFDTHPGIQRYITIEDNRVTGTWHAGVSTHNLCEYVTFKNNKIVGCLYGINVRCSHVEVLDNEIVNCTTGILMTIKPEQCKISGNRIFNTVENAIELSDLFTGWEPSYIAITDNTLQTCARGIVLVATQGTASKRGLRIIDNTVRDCNSSNGIRLVGSWDQYVIALNTVQDCTTQAIRLEGVKNGTVALNHIDTASTAFHVIDDATTSAVATGNLIARNQITSVTTVSSDTSTGTNAIRENSTGAGVFGGWDDLPAEFYNTVDQLTNYERFEMGWGIITANSFDLRAAKGGTGSSRVCRWYFGGLSSTAITVGIATNGGLVLGQYTASTAQTGGRTVVGGTANNTSTSGQSVTLRCSENFVPTATSTMVAVGAHINPTINYSNATPGAGSYEALKISVVETALPTGTNYVIRCSTGAAGTTDVFTVDRAGDVAAASASGTWVATQADQETGTSTATIVTPGRQHFHPSAAKFWVTATGNSTTILASYNMTSWADTGLGDADGTIATDFSSADWCGTASVMFTGGSAWDATFTTGCGFDARAAGTFGVLCSKMQDGGTAAAALVDPTTWCVVGFGDHA